MLNTMRKTIYPSKTYYESLDVIIENLRSHNNEEEDTLLIKKFLYHKANIADSFAGFAAELFESNGMIGIVATLIFLVELVRFISNYTYALPMLGDGETFDATAFDATTKFDNWFYSNLAQTGVQILIIGLFVLDNTSVSNDI